MDKHKIENLLEAIDEAKRFVKKAKFAVHRLQNDDYAGMIGSPETAAAKRSSMDLTRSLAKVRK